MKQRGATRGTEKEKYITKLLRVALKKYITGVFVFKPCLFHSEGGLMFVMFLLTRVVTQEVLHKLVKNVIKNAKKFTLTSLFFFFRTYVIFFIFSYEM